MNVFFSRLFWPLDKNCNQNRHGNRYVLLSKIPTYLQLPGSHIDLRMSCKNCFEKSCIILLLKFRLSLKLNLFVSSRTADKNVANSVWFCDLQSFFRNNVDVRYFLSHYQKSLKLSALTHKKCQNNDDLPTRIEQTIIIK